MNKIKKEKKCFPPKHFTFLLWLCNVIIGVKHMKVVQFKRSFHYIIPGREFSTTSNKKVTLELRVNPQCLEKIKIKVLVIYFTIFSMTLHFLGHFSFFWLLHGPIFCSIVLIFIKYTFKLVKQVAPCSLDIYR